MESLFIWVANGAVYSSLFTHTGGKFKNGSPSHSRKSPSDKCRLAIDPASLPHGWSWKHSEVGLFGRQSLNFTSYRRLFAFTPGDDGVTSNPWVSSYTCTVVYSFCRIALCSKQVHNSLWNVDSDLPKRENLSVFTSRTLKADGVCDLGIVHGKQIPEASRKDWGVGGQTSDL